MATALDEALALVKLWQAGADEYRQAQLCGYLSTIAVREYEIHLKNVLIGYANSCHLDFGQYVTQDLGRVNGKIMVDDINDRLARFGTKVRQKFIDLHRQATADTLASHKLDAVNAYNSIILNRHQFVHKGSLTLSLAEAQRYVEVAPKVLECVERALA